MSKQHILDEIRRTAKDNGGAALGVDRFEAETGIKESAWRGRYWARWSEAVREAGFTPNTRQPKTADDVLLSGLGRLVRELGRYPTVAEMRMRKRQDDSFPNHRVLERLGSRSELIARLSAFCERTDGWSDVAALCKSMAALIHKDAESGDNEDLAEGFVYLAVMRIGREKRFKIGKANLVEQRARQIAVTLPEDLELIHAIRTDDPYGIEGYWHWRVVRTHGNRRASVQAPEVYVDDSVRCRLPAGDFDDAEWEDAKLHPYLRMSVRAVSASGLIHPIHDRVPGDGVSGKRAREEHGEPDHAESG
jgi:hypothetical protein